ELVRSAIVFCGDSEFKQEVAENVGRIRKICNYIQNFDEVILTDEQVQTLVGKINNGKLANTLANCKAHVQGLSEIAICTLN
ncbi:MAG: hypothetical protein JEZ07_16605, partial [Phycisphaerae bacterium]|nr:hypothetical protein [Phycisphaerae bacterium]